VLEVFSLYTLYMSRVNNLLCPHPHKLSTYTQSLCICGQKKSRREHDLGLTKHQSVIPRVRPDAQLELFEGMVLYLSQADAAKVLEVSTRMIQYWESQGLLHPEYPQEGRSRRYTRLDLVEMAFIKAMVEDQGFSVPSLREKLRNLPAPYYYDPVDLFWDMRSQSWKSRSMLAVEHFNSVQSRLAPAMAELLEKMKELGPDGKSASLLSLIRDGLSGKLPEPRGKARTRKRRVRPRPSPLLQDQG
jgi:DNA-binding transcriptional MerR regulator